MKSLDSAESKREIKEEVNDICEYEDEDFCNNMSLMEAMGLPTSFINKSEVRRPILVSLDF